MKKTLYKIGVVITVIVLLNAVIAPAITTITVVKSLLSTVVATVFSSTYDTATPAGSDSPTQADDRMREIKAAIQERLDVCMYFPLGTPTATQVGDADAGEFRKVLFHEPIPATPTVAANHGDIRIKDVDGKAEMHWTDEDEQEVQITQVGQMCLGRSTAPIPVAQNTTAEDGDGGRETKIAAKGTQSGSEVTTLGYIEIAHDGAADDEKGRVSVVVNDGDDADAPSKIAMRWLSPGTLDVTNSVSVLDEDAMGTDSATQLATQQSIKAYADAAPAAQMTPATYAGGESVTHANGAIMKMGHSALDPLVERTITFGAAFPNALVSVVATGVSTQTPVNNVYIKSRAASNFHVKAETSHNGGFDWIAIGY